MYSGKYTNTISKISALFDTEQMGEFVREAAVMDRRQKRTREAIFSAFTTLLSERNLNAISVQDIIDRANVGRTTFYAHFETKDFLLRDLCEELFSHVINTALGHPGEAFANCSTPCDESVFLHLLRHLETNDRGITDLLSSENNEIFLRYFKENLKKLVRGEREKNPPPNSALPEDYVTNHIASSFVETVDWWISSGMRESAERVTEYFLCAISPFV